MNLVFQTFNKKTSSFNKNQKKKQSKLIDKKLFNLVKIKEKKQVNYFKRLLIKNLLIQQLIKKKSGIL